MLFLLSNQPNCTEILRLVSSAAMAFNLSGFDPELYYDGNISVNLLLFFFLVLPMLSLCMLCVVALVFAKEMNRKIRFLLVNVFASEICSWIGLGVLCLGWPIRQQYHEEILCRVFISLFIVGGVQKFTSAAIYAINIYVFVKYGEKKLKWHFIITYAVFSWILAIAFGIIPYLKEHGTAGLYGFCRSNINNLIVKLSVFILAAIALISVLTEIVFCVLTVVYMQRNVLESSTDVKRAITKMLAYVTVTSVLSLINIFAPVIIPAVLGAIISERLLKTLVANYMIHIVNNLCAIAMPVVAIVWLKPVRIALKTMFKKICVFISCVRGGRSNN